MKLVLVFVFLVQVFSNHPSRADAQYKRYESIETLLTKSQTDQLCDMGKSVTTLCSVVGSADKNCETLAKVVKGRDAECSHKNVCTFKIGSKTRYRRSLTSLPFFSKYTKNENQNIQVESGTVLITNNEKLNFEKKPGVQLICKKNLIIVNPNKKQTKAKSSTHKPSNKQTTPPSYPEKYANPKTNSPTKPPASSNENHKPTSPQPSKYQTTTKAPSQNTKYDPKAKQPAYKTSAPPKNDYKPTTPSSQASKYQTTKAPTQKAKYNPKPTSQPSHKTSAPPKNDYNKPGLGDYATTPSPKSLQPSEYQTTTKAPSQKTKNNAKPTTQPAHKTSAPPKNDYNKPGLSDYATTPSPKSLQPSEYQTTTKAPSQKTKYNPKPTTQPAHKTSASPKNDYNKPGLGVHATTPSPKSPSNDYKLKLPFLHKYDSETPTSTNFFPKVPSLPFHKKYQAATPKYNSPASSDQQEDTTLESPATHDEVPSIPSAKEQIIEGVLNLKNKIGASRLNQHNLKGNEEKYPSPDEEPEDKASTYYSSE